MPSFSRRDLFRRGAVAGTAVLLSGEFLDLLSASPVSAGVSGGYGPLLPDKAGKLDLPPGFRYQIIAKSGTWGQAPYNESFDVLDDAGHPPFPTKSDGTGSFPWRNGGTILVQNHEQDAINPGAQFTPLVPKTTGAPVYDGSATNAFGGTTNLVLDADANVQRRYVSLAGTIRNCAGGITPWGAWLTCEETESIVTGGKRHGYVFEVDSLGTRTTGEALVALGRYAHEAVAVDPSTNIAYLTEDASSPNGLLYRFTPTKASGAFGAYAAGGTLEALQASTKAGNPIDDLSQITTLGTVLDARWVPVPVADPDGTNASPSVRKQFAYPGRSASLAPASPDRVTRSKKFEGAFWARGAVWINASYAKAADLPASVSYPALPPTVHDGQVWKYQPSTRELTLVALLPSHEAANDYDSPGVFDGPDNICISPRGTVLLCEDGEGLNHVVGLDQNGDPFAFAQNKVLFQDGADLIYREFTGSCFSTDGRFLFVNVQDPGITYAITGPWPGGPRNI
jgi:secreted PhoX family phosphatase